MGALMVPSEHRRRFLEGYFGYRELPEDVYTTLEGFMLVAIFGAVMWRMRFFPPAES
jgi:hypothetical protein